MIDSLDSLALDHAIAGTMFAGKLHLYSSIESTNTLAMQEAAKGAPHGSAYIAEEQTAGRGRGAHSWHSEPYSGLYLSLLLRPRIAPADGLWLSLAAGLAVYQALHNVTNIVADIRWPNDLLVGRRKIAGILTEMNAEATQIRYAVVGIGINVSHGNFPAELRDQATSVHLESDRFISRQDLLAATLDALDHEFRPLMQPESIAEASARILSRLQQKSTWIRGKRVVVEEAEGYTGVTAGLDRNGFLLVETATGLRKVLSGGVRDPR